MIKLKKILEYIGIVKEEDAVSPEKKSINDEFKVNEFMLEDAHKILEKVNRKLSGRKLPPLELKILKTENIPIKSKLADVGASYVQYTVKIIGDIPEIKDYEFIAKIEHTEDGNIINQAPNTSVEKLPDLYKTFSQKCDVCQTNRERLNTFILKKIASTENDDRFEIGQFIVCGSTCLKKFLPLESVKAFLEYAVQLQSLRDILVDYENALLYGNDEEDGGGGGGRGYGRERIVYDQEKILTMICVSYFNDGGKFVSKSAAEKYGTTPTIYKTEQLLRALSPYNTDRESQKEANDIVERYKSEAEKMANNILTWAKNFDFDEAALDNPKFDSYYNNLKIMLNRPHLEYKHLGTFASLVSLYDRNVVGQKEKTSNQESEHYGTIGKKIVDIPVEVIFTTSIETSFGPMQIYNMKDAENHVFVYKGKILHIPGRPIIKGDKLLLSGTIKEHREYKGTKQTIIQRPTIKSV